MIFLGKLSINVSTTEGIVRTIFAALLWRSRPSVWKPLEINVWWCDWMPPKGK